MSYFYVKQFHSPEENLESSISALFTSVSKLSFIFIPLSIFDNLKTFFLRSYLSLVAKKRLSNLFWTSFFLGGDKLSRIESLTNVKTRTQRKFSPKTTCIRKCSVLSEILYHFSALFERIVRSIRGTFYDIYWHFYGTIYSYVANNSRSHYARGWQAFTYTPIRR